MKHILDLCTFLQEKFSSWASNSTCIEEVWTNFKAIPLQGIERFVPHKMPRKNSNPEYYNKEVKHLNVKVRKAYNRRTLGHQYLEELKQLSKQLLLAKKNA
jgi:hypothetical protein